MMYLYQQIITIFIAQKVKIIKSFLGIFIVATVFWLIASMAHGIEKAYLTYFTEASDYVIYYSIEPQSTDVRIGQAIFFVSDKERKQVIDTVRWNEKLYCKNPVTGKLEYHSALVDELDQANILERDKYTYRWTETVDYQTECVRKGVTTITLKYGVKKYIKNESKLFIKVQ